MYDKNGKTMVRQDVLSIIHTVLIIVSAQVDKEGGVGMEDAAGFFANVFGGERFMDYVSPTACRRHIHNLKQCTYRSAKYQL